jgi:hypothetical protein
MVGSRQRARKSSAVRALHKRARAAAMKGREMSEQEKTRRDVTAHVDRQLEGIKRYLRELFAKREAKENAD